MARYIIGVGWLSEPAIVEAPTLEAARLEARARSINAGVDREGLDDCAWAKAWDEQLAREVGLLPEDEPASFREALSQASRGPW